LEGLVKTRLEKKEQRKRARLAFKAEERLRKLDDVRARQEERIQRRQGLRVFRKPVTQVDSHSGRDDKDQAPPPVDDAVVLEQPIDPHNIHGGSSTADKFIRSKMIPGESM
jgi:hypothetical protein